MQKSRYIVRLTRNARIHIREIYGYIANQSSPYVAINTVRAIRKAMSSLSDMPYRIKLLDDEPWRSRGLRRLIVMRYYVYFVIMEESKKVQIIGVIYAGRDQGRKLDEIIGDEKI